MAYIHYGEVTFLECIPLYGYRHPLHGNAENN